MRTLTVDLGARSYPIHIGAGLLNRPEVLAPLTAGRQVLVVSNTTVAPLYLDRVLSALDAREVRTHVLPDGEAHKTYEQAGTILDSLVEARFARDCLVIALGGGVVGDIAGFAAACYHRGVGVVQIPTTLLSLVDSSVGGKTAVNHRLGKNLIGAFHQPECVLADTETLTTLAEREFRAGMAEVIKYGLVSDERFFGWLETNANRLLANEPQALAEAIYRCCQNKADMVAADERETGRRALLNLGHTFGHAIEIGAGLGTWLHGEAVAAGTAMATNLSVREGWLNTGDQARIESLLGQFGLPVRAPANLTPARMRELMGRDKKVLRGTLRLVLLTAIGRAVITSDFSDERLDQTLEQVREAA